MLKSLRAAYKSLPLPDWAKGRLKSIWPYGHVDFHPRLRRFGTIQELYPWRTDEGLDTRLYLQNFFSVFYPELDTRTEARLWCYDAAGRELARRTEPLGVLETLQLSLRDWMGGRGAQRGTLLWHIVLPEAVAREPECARSHAYYTDRGYIAYARGGSASFMHGIDRYAVFQGRSEEEFEPYYPDGETYSWRPEVPLGPALGCERLDVMTVNRTGAEAEVVVEARAEDGSLVSRLAERVPPRGLFCRSLERPELERLADRGRLEAGGLSTEWSRVMLLRHFASGAVAAMHC